jgi:hypothetical protein
MCEGLNVALLRSVSVNLAELRKAQTRVGKEDWGLGSGGLTACGRALKYLLTRR